MCANTCDLAQSAAHNIICGERTRRMHARGFQRLNQQLSGWSKIRIRSRGDTARNMDIKRASSSLRTAMEQSERTLPDTAAPALPRICQQCSKRTGCTVCTDATLHLRSVRQNRWALHSGKRVPCPAKHRVSVRAGKKPEPSSPGRRLGSCDHGRDADALDKDRPPLDERGLTLHYTYS